MANLSAETQSINLTPQGEVLLNNYADLAQQAGGMVLKPYQGIYFLA